MEKTRRQKVVIIIMALLILFLEGVRERYYLKARTLPFLDSKSYNNIWKTSGYFSIEGTWVIDDDKIVYPLKVGKITCYKSQMICKEETAIYRNIGNSVVSDDSPIVNLVVHNINKIDKNIIQYKENGSCSVTLGKIDTDNGDVSELTVFKDTNKCIGLFGVKPSKNQYVYLQDGITVLLENNKKIKTFKNVPLLWILSRKI